MSRKLFLVSIQLVFCFALAAQVKVEFDVCKSDFKRRTACLKFDAHSGTIDGNFLVVKGVGITVDKFKHTVQLISPQNEILNYRNIEDTLIFNSGFIDGSNYLFFTDNTGELFAGSVNNKLEFKGEAVKLLKLNPRKKNARKILSYNFPEIVFSNDNSIFAVVENFIDEISDQRTLRVNLFNDKLKLLKTELIVTDLGKRDFVFQSILINNEGVLFISGHSYYDSDFSVFSVGKNSPLSKYPVKEKQSLSTGNEIYSKLFLNELNEISLIEFETDENNNITKTNFLSFDDRLELTRKTESVIALDKTKVEQYKRFRFIKTLDIEVMSNGSFLFVGEYDNYSRYYNAATAKPPYLKGGFIMLKFNSDHECVLVNSLDISHKGVVADNMGILTKIVNDYAYFFYLENTHVKNVDFMVSRLDLVNNVFAENVIYRTNDIAGPIFYNNRINEASFIGRPYNLLRDKNHIDINDKSLIFFARDPNQMVKITIND